MGRGQGRKRKMTCEGRSVTWGDDVRKLVTPETMRLCEQIACELGVEDPGVVVQVTDQDAVHAALGLPLVPAGLEQGPTPQVSYDRFRAWLVRQAHLSPGVSATHQVDAPHTTCWHQLSSGQMHDIVYNRWQNVHWCSDIKNAGDAIPQICVVLCMMGTGRGRATIEVLPNVFY